MPPPFGDDPALAAMLCRGVAEVTLPTARAEVAAATASYLSMHAPGDDNAWGRRFASVAHDLRTGLPSEQALVRVCRGLSGNARCDMLRQALAMVSLEAMHGGDQVRGCVLALPRPLSPPTPPLLPTPAFFVALPVCCQELPELVRVCGAPLRSRACAHGAAFRSIQ